MKYEIGELDRRITFIAVDEEVENEIGEIELGDREIATVWAKVLEVKGKEKYKADKIDAYRDYEIICRYRPDINQTMEIEYKERRLEIISPPVELGRRRYLEIIAREKVSENDRYQS